MKQFLGYIIKKAVGKGKVSPTIKSVKPSPTVMKKGAQASVDKVRSDEYVKRIRELRKAEGKIKSGKQMIKEGQKERKKMIDTKRAFQFKRTKSTHPIKPGDKPEIKYKGNVREQKMGGGMMGRRFGMKKGTNPFKKETNVDKIKKTFAPKSGLKKIDPQKQKGLAKLKKVRPDVVRKMGYMKKGGRAGFKGGGADMTNVASDKTKREAKKFEKRAKAASKDVKNIGRSFTSIMNEKYRP